MFHMAEGCAAERKDRGTDGGVADDLDAKDVGEAGATILTVGAKDEVFTFLIEDQEAGYHLLKGETVNIDHGYWGLVGWFDDEDSEK